MADSTGGERRRSSSIRYGSVGAYDGDYSSFYRYGSNASEISVATEVGMAQDEMFSGPMSESVPTSVTSFAHRRSRADSNVSFTFYPEEDGSLEWGEDEAVIDQDDDAELDSNGNADPSEDLELGLRPSGSRKSSDRSASATLPLLPRRDSASTEGEARGRTGRMSQKIYLESEDLTIVVAGFRTSTIGSVAYRFLCLLTFGLAYLLFRWLPRLRIRLVGKPAPLCDCAWVVIENQWSEYSLHNVKNVLYGQSLSSVFGPQRKFNVQEYDESDEIVIKRLRSIDYRYIRFFYHPLKDKFLVGTTWRDPAWTSVRAVRVGLDTDQKDTRERVFGRNMIDIEEKTILQLLIDEAFHPFYVFQIASLILWSLDQYYYYATCIFLISVISITTTLIETKSTMRRLKDISRFECNMRVLRNGFWRYVMSSELVPGDIYEVTDPSLTQFPCDSLLLYGDCIVNESMLTGESVPVSKLPTTDEALTMLDLSASTMHSDIVKHVLFCGTKIIRARRPQDDEDDEAAAIALVLRTGFNTTKGALVRSMLFPKPSGFKFYRDSFRYISVMAIIAVVGFTASFINFIHLGLAWHLIVIRALDLITIVVPPALPATLTIGTNFALSRLKEKQIFCISPQRVNVGGKLDVVCFDKTGTLTEEGLDVLGVRTLQPSRQSFTDLLTDAKDVLARSDQERGSAVDQKLSKSVLHAMATCHSLRVVGKELVGDPLDIKMFQFTGWSFEEGHHRNGVTEDGDDHSLSPPVARPPPDYNCYGGDAIIDQNGPPLELGILRSFEFLPQLRRASVVVRQFGARSGDIYVKGAPECMADICKPESFPPDYQELLSLYTHRGFRVIALATKHIAKLNWVKVQKMTRLEAESYLDFLGFIIFENKLKPTTASVINELAKANIRTIMCTGDNILTAISVARECGLMERTAHCFVPHFLEGDSSNPLARLSWESIDDPAYRLDETTLKPLPPPAEADTSSPFDDLTKRDFSVAVTGDVFRWIIDFASDKVLQKMLVRGQVYARMSPDEKHELVEKLQAIDYTCGFCGDGANDCGALKAADVGISLSEAEASVAAPFTSRTFDITCVPEVIREGRAALVTSFSCFKYMSLYSAIQFTSVSFLYASASNLGDFQFLFIDLFLILPIAIFMGWTGSYPILARKRPTASLVSRKVLTPLLGHIFLSIVIQLVGYGAVRRQPWFMPPRVDKDQSNVQNSENTALFLLSCYQYILTAVVISVGPPFRQSMAHNRPFVITMVVALLVTTLMLFAPPKWLYSLMDLTKLSLGFKLFLLLLGFGGFAVACFADRRLFPRLARYFGTAKSEVWPQKRKKRKLYKEIRASL